ncbi:hypothetical protein B0T16DRAFT_453932 [Cercophora newfieldiana]|uniref:Uncharacterized protein n=1 Tax=Cercophora newfieldiana TaxID=92897 RepID=A0AA40CTZ4_9PEZI|nr:hypothetical protein B0T16DRAFT_453932 [Cercophora newfieldiana]
MGDFAAEGHAMALGPRVPRGSLRRDADLASMTWGSNLPSRVMGRAAESSCASANLCEKPVGGQTMTVAIALGVCIPLVAAFGALIYLHRRGVKKQRMEDMADPHKSLDFGLEHGGAGGKSKRKSFLGREKDDKSRLQRQQMSMDMNLSSPYLLPPTMQNSRESLNSLARTLQGDADPYKPIAAYAASDAGSVRSMPMGGGHAGSPPYTRSNSRQDRGSFQRPLQSPGFPPRQNSLPKSGLSSPEAVYAKPEPIISEELLPPAPLAKDAASSMAPYPEESQFPIGTAIQEPPTAAQKVARKPILSPAQPSPADSGVEMGYENPFDEKKHLSQESTISSRQTAAGLGLVDQLQPMQPSARSSADSGKGAPVTAAPQLGPIAMTTGPIIEEPTDFYDYNYAQEPEMPRDPQGLQPLEEERGRNMQRQSHLYDQQGLGVPSRDSRRLSVGFRPLPPDEIMETEDPEHRANRIRSFYKEYFEETNPSNEPPVPPMPAEHQRGYQQGNPHHQNNGYNQGNNQYYEDYSEGYAQDAPYFDPASNSFVMPYAQPVSRRAMTPPPSGQRFPGPRGPPRQMHGSMGGNRMPGPRGPPRPGSSVSNQMYPGSRPGSSASAAYGRRRADSAMSGSRYGGGPKKPIPPPADLNTLPTPAMLKDDSFALFNSMDFAPPESFQSRARGRSQSPLGERRAFNPAVPAHSPLVTAFEDLPVLPSPHSLRKSSTFTGLDFAPPRKFTENDNRSDAGSIRSNRSGISAVQLGAIRNGAGRVSRLPGDTIFTQVAMPDKLKPQWGMRD